MRTIVHIGAHRTGTTSIQAALLRNEERLFGAGITAITAANARDILFDPLQKYAEADGDERAQKRETLSIVFNEISNAAKPCHTLIYSEENIIGNMAVIFERKRMGTVAIDNLKAIAEFLPDDFEIVISIREYASYYTSAFSYQFCKSVFKPFKYYKRMFLTRPHGWTQLIGKIKESFPNNKLTVVPFETYSSDFSSFFRHLGFPSEIKLDVPHENRTRSDLAIKRLEKHLAAGTDFSKTTVKSIVKRAHKYPYEHYDPWTAEEKKILAARYRRHINQIKRILNVNFIE